MIHFIREIETVEDVQLAIVQLGQAAETLSKVKPELLAQAKVLDPTINCNIPSEFALSRIEQGFAHIRMNIQNWRAAILARSAPKIIA